MTDTKERKEPERRDGYERQDDSRRPPHGSPVHQTGDAEPVHGPDDPLIPPGYERAP